MADNKIEIKVTADTAQAVTELGAVEKGLKATGTQAQQLGASSGAAGTALVQAGQGAAATATQLDKVQASATSTGTAFAQIGPLIAGAFAGAQMVKTITEADSLQRGMLAVAGSSQAAATEMAFIRKTSNDLGLELQSTGKAYLSLMAATKGTALEGQATREVFTSVSRAMSALGRSTAETENALRAVSQIASKGTVSMEELRGQLGEALPGAMTAAAAGMGVTTQELVKMVESGGVLAKDLLPALTGELDKLYASGGQTDSLVANFNRFKNAVSEVSIKLGEAGLAKALADIAIVGAQAVGTAGTAIVGLGKGIGSVAGAVATLDFKPLAEDLGLTSRAAGDLEVTLFDAMGNLIGTQAGAQDLASALPALTTELASVGSSAGDAGNQAKESFRKMELAAQSAEPKLSQTAKNAVAEFDKLKTSGDTAAEAIGKVGKNFDLSTLPGIKDAASVLDKLAADGKISATEFARAWTTQLKGVDLADFAAKARKAFDGSAQDAGRLKDVLDQGVREAIRRTGLDFDVIAGGMGKAARSAINDTQAIITGLDGLKKQGVDTGQVLTASIGKSINAADSKPAIDAVKAQIESLRKVLGEKITDGLLDQAKDKALALGDAMDKAKPGINSLREAMALLGVTSDESLKKTAKTSQEAYDTMKASGTSSARELADGFRKMANDQLAAAGEVGSSQRAVTEAVLQTEGAVRGLSVSFDKNGKLVVQTQAEATAAIIESFEALNRQQSAVQKVTSALEQQNAAQERVNAAAEKAAELERKRLGVDKEGFSTDKNGSRLVAGGDLTTRTGIKDFLKKAGVNDDAEATRITNEFANSKGEIDYFNNAGQMKYGGASSTISQALLKAAEKYTFAGKPIGGANSAAPPTPGTSPAPTPSNSSQTVLVKIDLGGGKSFDVNTASAGDASQLQNFIGALQNAKRAAGM